MQASRRGPTMRESLFVSGMAALGMPPPVSHRVQSRQLASMTHPNPCIQRGFSHQAEDERIACEDDERNQSKEW